jgi:hypothetical protein
MKADTIVYWVDRHDNLSYVNEAWDHFATQNDAPDISGEAVTGRSLWDFVSDTTTRQLYRDLMVRARAGNTLRFTFRCDGPRRRRRMEMTMAAARENAVEFRSRVLADAARGEVALLERGAPRDDELITLCSWCKRARSETAWVEVEEAVASWRLLERPALPMLTHGICESCLRELSAAAGDPEA